MSLTTVYYGDKRVYEGVDETQRSANYELVPLIPDHILNFRLRTNCYRFDVSNAEIGADPCPGCKSLVSRGARTVPPEFWYRLFRPPKVIQRPYTSAIIYSNKNVLGRRTKSKGFGFLMQSHKTIQSSIWSVISIDTKRQIKHHSLTAIISVNNNNIA